MLATGRRQGFTVLGTLRTTRKEAAPWCRPRPLPLNDRPSRYRPSVDFRG